MSMLLIIMHHYTLHGGFHLYTSHVSLNTIFLHYLLAGGKLGVNCFVLITGFFLVKSKFTFVKLFKITFSVFTYSILIYTLFYSYGLINYNIRQIIRIFFPIIFNEYWFATNYTLLYIFSPFLNNFINCITREQHFKLIALFVLTWSIVPTITSANFIFSPTIWFAILYFISAYIRLYQNNLLEKFNLKTFFIIYACILLSIALLDIIGLKINFLGRNSCYFTEMNSFPLLLCSLSLFIGFNNFKTKQSKIINLISSSMFGIYLIHDNNIVRGFLWTKILKNNQYYESNYLFLHAFISVLLVFFTCIIIDKIKQNIIDNPFFYLFNRFSKSKNIPIILRKLNVINDNIKKYI